LGFEEVAEASERIHKEVGDEAEIFWGTSIDESLGDDVRVTVIATGIGAETEVQREKEKAPAKEKERKLFLQPRGVVRDITPADAERSDIVDLDEPTFIRHRRVAGESSGAVYRGVGRIALDENDLDVPTFLRRKAD
jgi:cell division protein FtsZ